MDDHTILASEENFGSVTVCPGGVVHIHLPHFSLKFISTDFVKFHDMIAKARLQLDMPRRADGKPRLHLVSPETNDQATPEQAD